jgi:hypothetical protein
VVRAPNRILVVLDDEDRVPGTELPKSREQETVVLGMEADRRLVEDVTDSRSATELRREPNALSFPPERVVAGRESCR